MHFCQNLVCPLRPLATWLPLCSIVQPLTSPWLSIVGSQRKTKDLKLMKIISKLNIFTTTGMRHLLSKFSLPSKTLRYLASIVFYCLTFGFCLASHCKKPTRNPVSKIDENDFKVEFFCHWTCTTFWVKI